MFTIYYLSFFAPTFCISYYISFFSFLSPCQVNGCSWGLTTQGGAKEVGESATRAVVTTWVAIFIMDFILALVLFQQPIL
ncbi:MAG: ABC transporter permease [Cuspidothrix sp.]